MNKNSNQKSEDAERSRMLAQRANERTIRIVKINNGYKVVEVLTGKEFAYPGLGFPLMANEEPTNVLEHIQDFFSRVETKEILDKVNQ